MEHETKVSSDVQIPRGVLFASLLASEAGTAGEVRRAARGCLNRSDPGNRAEKLP